MSKEKNSSYLLEYRLAEVLALIQVLSYDKYTSRSESGLSKELKNKPESAESWMKLAACHPELFRVNFEEENEIDEAESENKTVKRASLISRYVLPHEIIKGKKIRPQLESNIVNRLMGLALEIHDRQLTRKEQWKILIPMVIAIIGATASISAALIKSST